MDVPVRLIGIVDITIFITSILGAYYLYVRQGGAPWLPEISDTWVRPPGTQLSRIGVGLGCSGLAWLQYSVCWADHAGRRLHWLALLAAFLLSVVGAVCESDAETCRGNQIVHSVSAVAFFVLYDCYMLLISCHKRCTLSTALAVLSCAATAGTATARAQPHRLLGDPLWVAYIEWINVALIMLWTLIYVLINCPGLAVKLEPAPSPSRPPIACWSLGWISRYGMFALGVVVLFLPMCCALLCGAKSELPPLSALWVSQPGNWFAHWGCCQGAVAIFAVALASQTQSKLLSLTALPVTLVAAGALVLLGTVTEFESPELHRSATEVYFGTSTAVVLVCTAVGDRSRLADWLLCAIVCLVAVRLVPGAPGLIGGWADSMEYAHWVAMLIFWWRQGQLVAGQQYQLVHRLHTNAYQMVDLGLPA